MEVRCRAVFVCVSVCAFKDARVFQTCGRAEGAHGRRFERAHGDVFNAHPHTSRSLHNTTHHKSPRTSTATSPLHSSHTHPTHITSTCTLPPPLLSHTHIDSRLHTQTRLNTRTTPMTITIERKRDTSTKMPTQLLPNLPPDPE